MNRIVMLSLAMLSTPAAAQQSAPTTAPLPAAQAPSRTAAKPKMVCRTDPEIGTLFAGKKTCMTVEQWDRNAREGRMELEHSTTTMTGRVGGN